MSCRQTSVDTYCRNDARDTPNHGSRLYPVTSWEYSIMCNCSNAVMLVYICIVGLALCIYAIISRVERILRVWHVFEVTCLCDSGGIRTTVIGGGVITF